jgi:hypothetical protein
MPDNRDEGREIVVLLITIPSIPDSCTTNAMSLNSFLVTSGAILTRSGGLFANPSLSLLTSCKRVSMGSRRWSDLSPGVFGLDIFTTM